MSQLSTGVLVDRHNAHNLAIANIEQHALHHSYEVETAKRNKCLVKHELIMRAVKDDDHVAIAYATRRGWPGFERKLQAVAAE